MPLLYLFLYFSHFLSLFLSLSIEIQDTNETQDCAYFYLLTINEDRDTALLSLVKSFTQSAEMVLLVCHMMASSKQIDNTIGTYNILCARANDILHHYYYTFTMTSLS